jgi:ketosteroid isomerase-like protein
MVKVGDVMEKNRSQPMVMSRETPQQVLQSIVEGINAGNIDGLMSLYESEAAFAAQPGDLVRGLAGVRQSLTAFINMKGTLDLKVTRVLEAGGLALVVGVWSFAGSGADGAPVTLTGRNADVLRRQTDGSWRFVIDNPWGVD